MASRSDDHESPLFGRMVYVTAEELRARFPTAWVKEGGRLTTYFNDGTSRTEEVPTEIVFSKPDGDWNDL